MPDKSEFPAAGPDRQLPAGPPVHSRRRPVRVVIWGLLLVVFVLAFVLILHRHADADKAASRARPTAGVPTTTANAEKGDIGIYIDSIGTVTPVYTDSITSQVNGQIVSVHFTEGQRVNKGDALIDIDPRPYQATLLQAQGILQRDENLLGQARMDLERYEAAWQRNAIAKQMLDDQQKLVLQDEGVVKNDQGTVQYDQVQVDFCHITSPIDGRVGLRLVDPGNVVQASGTTPLVVVTQLEPITVVFVIPEDSLSQVAPRMRQNTKLTVEAYDRTAQTKIATGQLLTLDNQIDTTTGTVKARSIFDNKNDAMFPNQFVNTRLLVNTLHGVTLVPSSAIQQNGQSSFVYVIQNGVAHIHTVKPGATNAGVTQVDGINPGDVVANSSFDKLQDNISVVVSNSRPSSNGSSTQ